MSRVRRNFREGPGIDSNAGPSNDACLIAQRVVDSCTSYMQPPRSLFRDEGTLGPAWQHDSDEDRQERGLKPKRRRAPQSAKQKRHTAAFARRMKACGKKWRAKTDAAKAKTTYRDFQAKFCRK